MIELPLYANGRDEPVIWRNFMDEHADKSSEVLITSLSQYNAKVMALDVGRISLLFESEDDMTLFLLKYS